MLSHVFIGIDDFERAYPFYAELAAVLKLVQKFRDPAKGWAAWTSPGVARPLLVIGRPYNGEPAHPGNGPMIALLASDRTAVDMCHAVALAAGGRCEGAPGLRPQYHANYYGAYFRDLDGNKLCVCCHEAAPSDES